VGFGAAVPVDRESVEVIIASYWGTEGAVIPATRRLAIWYPYHGREYGRKDGSQKVILTDMVI
jgi:hypothetical protein